MEIRKKIRPLALTILFSSLGVLIVFLLKNFSPIPLSKSISSLIGFILNSALILTLFPRVFKIPFGKVKISEFLFKSGLYLPQNKLKFIILGMICAILSLSGMLAGSLLTDKYIWDKTTLSLGQALFSLSPAVWEEIMFRGIMVILLMRFFHSVKKAFIIQIIIFGLLHIKGFGFWELFDIISVMFIAASFSYSAYKTKSLIPGIIFHYLHDTFLYTVQLPDGIYEGTNDNLLFYAMFWLSLGLTLFFIKNLSEKFNITVPYCYYDSENKSESNPSAKDPENKTNKLLLINLLTFSILLISTWKSMNLYIIILIILFILSNLFLFFYHQKIHHRSRYLSILSSFISFVSAYDSYSQGSRKAYIAWIIIGIFHLLIMKITISNTANNTKKKS